jgi:20S proteasome alpha/beta subunit
MTICFSVANQEGIVMAAERRSLTAGLSAALGGFKQREQPINYEIFSNDDTKVFLLGNRYGLSYSGTSYTPSWNLAETIGKVNQLAERERNILRVGDTFYSDLLKNLPQGAKFNFHIGTNTDRGLILAGYQESGLSLGFGAGCRYIPELHGKSGSVGFMTSGETSIIKKLFDGENLNPANLPIQDLIQFCELTVKVGYSYLKFFEGYQQVSGGGVDILVITPTWAGFVKHSTLELFDGQVVPLGKQVNK